MTEAFEDLDELVCPRCGPPTDRSRPGHLADAARCLAIDGRIDRAHVEAVHRALGAYAFPLAPRLVATAIAARPELATAATLVAGPDAILVTPAENWRARLASLESLQAPDVILADARARLAEAEASPVAPTWDRVHAWPAPAAFPGTVAFGAIARTMAALAIPPLVGHDARAILAAIDRAIEQLALSPAELAFRNALAAEPAADPRRARGLELAVRFLDELGHTDLRDNQDTLVDDCYFALAGQDLTTEAAAIYPAWLAAVRHHG